MPECSIDLESLLTSTRFLSASNIEGLAWDIYCECYCDVYDHKAHDGDNVTFFSERFSHAFFKSSDASGRGQKDGIDVQRVERILWIRELIGGVVPKSECLLVPNTRKDRPAKRLYIIDAEHYVVWLEPLKDGGWVFSSAYKAMNWQIKGYRKKGKVIWKFGWILMPRDCGPTGPEAKSTP